jgi:16S rRNA G527 N7-methylase RsmG
MERSAKDLIKVDENFYGKGVNIMTQVEDQANLKARAERLKNRAESVIPRALRSLDQASNLAAYGLTKAQREAILTALKNAVARVEARFNSVEQKESGWRLPS